MGAKPLPSTKDAAAWVRSVGHTVGRPCAVCSHPEMRGFVEEVVRLWAAGEAPSLSWPKLATEVRARFGTRTVWESIRRHIEVHTDLWGPLNEWRRSQH